MSDISAARRWAQAVDQLAVESGHPEVIAADLGKVSGTIAGEGQELLTVLASPLFTSVERRNVLDAVLTKLEVSGTVASFLRLLTERGRFAMLPLILAEFTRLSDARLGRIRVQITTVDPLTDELRAALVASFSKATGKEVLVEASLDPSLLAGLVARVDSRVYDASLRTRLEDLKNRLIHSAVLPQA